MFTTTRVLVTFFLFASCLLGNSGISAAGELTTDASTLLLLHCNGTMVGGQGESPLVQSGIGYEAGVFGQGAHFAATNVLTYDSADNIDAVAGTVEFWVKPGWQGADALNHAFVKYGTIGGLYMEKDGGNYLHIDTDRYGPNWSGAGFFLQVGEWEANEWKHCAFTWDDEALRVFVNGQLRASSVPVAPPPAVTDVLQIGAYDSYWGLDAVLDELRISDRARTSEEIQSDFLQGLVVSGLSVVPDTIRALPSWFLYPKIVAVTQVGSVELPLTAVAWTSSASAVASVDAQGRLKANSPGTAILTAERDGASGDLVVEVEAPALPPAFDTVSPELSTPAPNAAYEVPVLVLRYIPTKDGVNHDYSVDPDFWWLNPVTVDEVRNSTGLANRRFKYALEEGSRYHGYTDPTALPSLGYRVVGCITVYERTPPGEILFYSGGWPVYGPDYDSIFERFDVQHCVNDLGVKEIWFWSGGFDASYPCFDPDVTPPENFRLYWESNMSSPVSGDVSNSNRDPGDLPVYDHTYIVYGRNFRRLDTSIEGDGHRLEQMLTHVSLQQDGTSDLFWKEFIGQDEAGSFITGRCGWTHMPPNTVVNYATCETTTVLSDIEDWTPDRVGQLTAVNRDTWNDKVYAWPGGYQDLPRCSLQWFVYWRQNIPGLWNLIPLGEEVISNWWQFVGDWDGSLQSGKGLHESLDVNAVTSRAGRGVREGIIDLRVVPTPGRAAVVLDFTVARTAGVKIRVVDVGGRVVSSTDLGRLEVGHHAWRWDCRTEAGNTLPGGVYYAQVRGAGPTKTLPVVIVR